MTGISYWQEVILVVAFDHLSLQGDVIYTIDLILLISSCFSKVSGFCLQMPLLIGNSPIAHPGLTV